MKIDFYPSKTNKSGVQGDCKVCYRIKVTTRQAAYRAHMEKMRKELGLGPMSSPTSRSDTGKKHRPRDPNRKYKENWPVDGGKPDAIHAPEPSQEPPPSFNSLFHLPTPGKED